MGKKKRKKRKKKEVKEPKKENVLWRAAGDEGVVVSHAIKSSSLSLLRLV